MKAFKLFIMLCFTILMASCGSDAKSVADKIDQNKPLTQDDYTEIVNYCGKFAKEAQKFQNQIDALPDNSVKASKDNQKLAELKEKFPYLDKFNKALMAATPEQVGNENVRKVNELAQYLWFTAPDWATIQDDPNVSGFIEQTPDSDTSNVIAGSAGEVVSVPTE
ncbi:MAG: hypothetical protein NC201_05920 [Prevotella sp.]|nr:hypothetical protein [Bacteroides sp.]MCM1366771.1 hypothetical protein [Prevotella sp.]MCM1437390.1 hypothetical protein [Prevotella sp.]